MELTHAYAVLGLESDATDDEVEAAYHRLVEELYHPDHYSPRHSRADTRARVAELADARSRIRALRVRRLVGETS